MLHGMLPAMLHACCLHVAWELRARDTPSHLPAMFAVELAFTAQRQGAHVRHITPKCSR